MVTEAADLLEKVSALLSPYDTDEWNSPSGRRVDLPNRGNVLGVPLELNRIADDRVAALNAIADGIYARWARGLAR